MRHKSLGFMSREKCIKRHSRSHLPGQNGYNSAPLGSHDFLLYSFLSSPATSSLGLVLTRPPPLLLCLYVLFCQEQILICGASVLLLAWSDNCIKRHSCRLYQLSLWQLYLGIIHDFLHKRQKTYICIFNTKLGGFIYTWEIIQGMSPMTYRPRKLKILGADFLSSAKMFLRLWVAFWPLSCFGACISFRSDKLMYTFSYI